MTWKKGSKTLSRGWHTMTQQFYNSQTFFEFKIFKSTGNFPFLHFQLFEGRSETVLTSLRPEVDNSNLMAVQKFLFAVFKGQKGVSIKQTRWKNKTLACAGLIKKLLWATFGPQAVFCACLSKTNLVSEKNEKEFHSFSYVYCKAMLQHPVSKCAFTSVH